MKRVIMPAILFFFVASFFAIDSAESFELFEFGNTYFHLYSLKNQHVLDDYMAVGDMLNGGFRIFKKDAGSWNEKAWLLPGWTMAWNPYIVKINNQYWIYFCDTNGHTTNWWEYMRIYRMQVNFNTYLSGPVQKVDVYQEEHGLIDPCLWEHNGWWYLCVARIVDSDSQRYWDPAISVSTSPAGPFYNKWYIGISDPSYVAKRANIDEAFKVFNMYGYLCCVWSSGDSGNNGISHFGYLVSAGTDPEGWIKWWVNYVSDITSDDPQRPLCTAPCWYQNEMYITTRDSGGKPDGRDRFRIGILDPWY